VAILRERDARVGCLAVPITMLAGFVIGILGAAAVGAGARTSTLTGGVLAMVGLVIAAAILVRSGP
jgi:F0F1-type ATP synthase membrane subunit c/vacuolar-type H+-ATPase subunit K